MEFLRQLLSGSKENFFFLFFYCTVKLYKKMEVRHVLSKHVTVSLICISENCNPAETEFYIKTSVCKLE